jgi:hypothetical protein
VDVVDDEVVVRRSRHVIHHLAPRPASSFIEHDVVRHPHTLCHWIEDAVAFHTFVVADEHSRSASIIKLADVVQLLDVDEGAEHSQVATSGLRPCQASYGVIPSSALVGERLRMYTASPQNLAGIPRCLRARAMATTVDLVALLDDAVLLRTVRRGEVSLDSLVGCSTRRTQST